MRRLLSVLAVLVVSAMLAPAHAQIAGPPDNGSDQLVSSGARGGGYKHVAKASPRVESHVGMPGPLNPEPGPVAAGSELMPSRGSAIVHPTGGSFISREQQADREIHKLIRKLG